MASKDADIQLNQVSTFESRGDDTKGIVTGRDIDEALVYLQDHIDAGAGQSLEIDDKKLIRKIDWMLMPLMFACYYLQYTDKTLSRSHKDTITFSTYTNDPLVSYSGIMGIIEDTHMPANGFSNLAIAFYVSFLVCEPIQSFLLQRFPTAKWLGINGTLTSYFCE